MPLCSYGAACTRKDCIYRHDRTKMSEDKSDRVCLPHLAGTCPYGQRCRNVHLNDDESAAMRLKFKSKPCVYGASCKTASCLFLHPWEQAEQAMEAMALNSHKIENLTDFGGHAQSVAREASISGAQTVVAPSPAVPMPPHWAARCADMSPQVVVMPQELWVDSTARDASAFEVADPLERAALVARQGQLSDQVIDLHFQSANTFSTVLDALLLERLTKLGPIWIVTGALAPGTRPPGAEGSHRSDPTTLPRQAPATTCPPNPTRRQGAFSSTQYRNGCRRAKAVGSSPSRRPKT